MITTGVMLPAEFSVKVADNRFDWTNYVWGSGDPDELKIRQAEFLQRLHLRLVEALLPPHVTLQESVPQLIVPAYGCDCAGEDVACTSFGVEELDALVSAMSDAIDEVIDVVCPEAEGAPMVDDVDAQHGHEVTLFDDWAGVVVSVGFVCDDASALRVSEALNGRLPDGFEARSGV